MAFTPWPHQVRGVADITSAISSGKKRMCYTSVTGSGKSWIICSVIEWAVARGMRVVLYSNRRLLTEQLMGQLQKDGISFGVRAAEYDEHIDDEAPVQICSIQTDQARIIGRRKKAKLLDTPEIARRQFPLHPADLVIADEIHLQCAGVAESIFNEYVELGAVLIGVTATPLGVSHICKELILGCNTSEGRRCGALLPAMVFGCPELDTSKIERVKTSGGEFSLADIRKNCWSQAIYGHVHSHLLKNNPDMKPFLLFAPGVEESVGFDRHLNSMGIKTAHIDGEDCVVNGERYKSSRDVRRQIIADVKSGHIFGISNRFVLREAVDIPELYMLVLACPIGSLLSYVQICLDSRTEILTKRGWAGIGDIREDDVIAQMDMESGGSSWSECLGITKREIHKSESMVEVSSPHLSIRMTDSHDFVMRSRTEKSWRKVTGRDLMRLIMGKWGTYADMLALEHNVLQTETI